MEAGRDGPLPIILVSAKDEESASEFITELIDNEVKNNDDELGANTDRVWRLVNKYYTADVRLHALGDSQQLDSDLLDLIEAHVVYLTADEVAAGAELVSRRMSRAAAGVRAVAAALAHEPAPLRAAALRARADLVPLRAAPAGAGLTRARDVLHAHVWPGARLLRGVHEPRPQPPAADDEWGEWHSSGPPDAFAAALAALPAAAAAAREPVPRAERLARAERVLALFCNALGAPLD